MTAALHAAQVRLARHYLHTLQQAEQATRRGRANRAYWLSRVEQEWGQIKHWQAWCAAQPDAGSAHLCVAFPLAMSTLLRSRQPQAEFIQWGEQALTAARRLGDGEAERALLYKISFVSLNIEALEAASHYAQQLVERAQAAGDALALGRALSVLGAADLLRGAYDRAERLLTNSLERLSPFGADEALTMVWLYVGRLAAVRGDYHQAQRCYEQFLTLAAAADRPGWVSTAYRSLSSLYLRLHDYPAAEAQAQLAVAICRSHGFARGLQAALVSLAQAETGLGKFETACHHYEEVMAGQAFLPPSTLIECLHGLGRLQLQQGDVAQAFHLFHDAATRARTAKLVFHLCEVLPYLVTLHLKRQEWDAARARLLECISAARQLNTLPFLVKALSAAVLVWQADNRPEQAAVWAGLLTQYDLYLDPILFNSTVYQLLQVELGTDQYHCALEQGTRLTLDRAVTDVWALLHE
ncbi:MAG: tetratricopeptide repeat protein [Chloroflexi bacterium]|nr:tetratricopeptide repeat protein [Chloroflexota bacterium]